MSNLRLEWTHVVGKTINHYGETLVVAKFEDIDLVRKRILEVYDDVERVELEDVKELVGVCLDYEINGWKYNLCFFELGEESEHPKFHEKLRGSVNILSRKREKSLYTEKDDDYTLSLYADLLLNDVDYIERVMHHVDEHIGTLSKLLLSEQQKEDYKLKEERIADYKANISHLKDYSRRLEKAVIEATARDNEGDK